MGAVISASRRTDIPAFYSEWFMNRIRAGYVVWQNPFSHIQYKTSLHPDDVWAIVFWSKNYRPLLPHLDTLDSLGYRMVFHFTITGLPKLFEPNVPDLSEAIHTASYLAERYGSEVVLWRYDPVLISDITGWEYHLARFRQIAASLENVTRRCYFSFPVLYKKVRRNAQRLHAKTGIAIYEVPKEKRIELALEMANIAVQHGIEMYSCCGDYLVDGRIMKAHCVDAELLNRLFPNWIGKLRRRPTRKECGCYESVDIGAYNTCAHGCIYCYANANKNAARRAYEEHDPNQDSLAPPPTTHYE